MYFAWCQIIFSRTILQLKSMKLYFKKLVLSKSFKGWIKWILLARTTYGQNRKAVKKRVFAYILLAMKPVFDHQAFAEPIKSFSVVAKITAGLTWQTTGVFTILKNCLCKMKIWIIQGAPKFNQQIKKGDRRHQEDKNCYRTVANNLFSRKYRVFKLGVTVVIFFK